MSYDGIIMQRAIARFDQARQRRAAELDQRRREVFARQPRLRDIDRTLRTTMSRIVAAAAKKGEDPLPALRVLRDENLSLQRERAALLEDMGYPADYLEDNRYILRPANFSGRMPGRGCGVYDCGKLRIAVMTLIGRCDLDWKAADPFTTADKLLRELNETEKPTFTLLDFHAQATSEKLALGYYLDGRISAMWGTHTHVPTADERVMPKGTGYITDLGMTGAIESVLGIPPEQSIESFLGGLAGRYRFADGPCKAQGCIFTLDSDTGLCTAVERVDIR